MQMQMQMIQVELFIDAVRKRPALWDSDCNDYKDRLLKKDGWLEVCQIMCPKFADKSEEERTQIGRDMQLKWKNLRDAYVRHIRLQMNRSKSSKPLRSYIYHKQMAFLTRVINPRLRSPIFSLRAGSSMNLKVEDDEELTQEDLMEMVDHDAKSGVESPNFALEDEEEPVAEEDEDKVMSCVDPLMPEVGENAGSPQQDSNDDMDFFKSLLPTLQTLRTDQKLKFRIDVMELLMTYHQTAAE